MSKMVKKSFEEIRAEISPEQVKGELKKAAAEEAGLDSETLAKFKPVGDRFKNLVGREPRSQRVTIRFENNVLSFIKKDAERLGKPYQTHINDILRTYAATSRPQKAKARKSKPKSRPQSQHKSQKM